MRGGFLLIATARENTRGEYSTETVVRPGETQPIEDIMRRYAGMVFNVAYRVTRNTHDAEDATQAVFLALAAQLKTGASIRYIGAWLQQVAHRLALDIRRSKKRRARREQIHGEIKQNRDAETDAGREGPVLANSDELRTLVAEELNRLPTKYRLPLVLHYFGGMSREEIATELGCKPSTLGVRLHRARARLGTLLSRRGVDIAPAVLAGMLGHVIHAAVTQSIVNNTTSAASALARGGSSPADIAHTTTAMAAKIKAFISLSLAAGSALAAGAQALGWVDARALVKEIPAQIDAVLHVISAPLFRTMTPAIQASNIKPAGEPPVALIDPRLPDLSNSMERPSGSIDPVAKITGAMTAQIAVSPPAVNNSQIAVAAKPSAESSGEPGSAANHAYPPDAMTPLVSAATNAGKRAPSAAAASTLARPDAVATTNDLSPNASSASVSASATSAATAYLDISNDASAGTGGGGSGWSSPSASLISTGMFVGPPSSPAPARAYIASSQFFNALITSNANIFAPDANNLTQRGGAIATDALKVGTNSHSIGTVNIDNSNVNILATRALIDHVSPAVVVGVNGPGILNLGSQDFGGTITELPEGSGVPLTVGQSSTSPGLIQGWGTINLTGQLTLNGQIIANGFGSSHTLDLSSFGTGVSAASPIAHTLNNTASQGWYAINGGRLKLPSFAVKPGSGVYTWGDDPQDTTLDLTNSLRLTTHNALHNQVVSISLLASDRSDVPSLPTGIDPIGIWSITPAASLGSADVTVHYDNQMLIAGATPKLFGYENGAWALLSHDYSLDRADRLITGLSTDASLLMVGANPSQIAPLVSVNFLSGGGGSDAVTIVPSVPEPTSLGLIALSGLLTLRRRRKP